MSSVLGCAISIVGNVVVSLSLNIQRLAHKKLGDDEDDGSECDQFSSDDGSAGSGSSGGKGSNYLTSGWWWTGIMLMAVGECGNFTAYAFAPASVVATLGTTGLIANVFFAPLILHERFHKTDLLGVAIAIVGGVTVVLSAQAEQPTLSPDEIIEAISQTNFKIYFLLVVVLIATLAYLSPKYGQKYILVDLGLVALCGGFTALATKGVSSLLSTLFYKALKYPIFWIMVVILVITAILQVRYLNRSLARFDSTRVIPCQFCTFTISTILGSAILYRDFERMGAKTIAAFIFGCFLTFLGVWITSYRGQTQSESASHTSPPTRTQRITRTISTVFSEQSPLVDEIIPGSRSRPKASRLQSSNAQSGPLLNYFVAKAENTRHRNSFNHDTLAANPSGLLRVPSRALQSSSI